MANIGLLVNMHMLFQEPLDQTDLLESKAQAIITTELNIDLFVNLAQAISKAIKPNIGLLVNKA